MNFIKAVCVDVKLLGTTEGLSQNSAMLVLLHEYVRFWVHTSWAYDVMAQNIVIYVMPGFVRV
jgi:hypothetical protein